MTKIKNFDGHPVPLILTFVLISSLSFHAVTAQDATVEENAERLVSEPTTKSSDDHVVTLLEQLRGSIDALERYRRRLDTASQEDALVLRMQITAAQLEALQRVHGLADGLLTSADAAPDSELRDQILDLMTGIAPSIQQEIDRLRVEIDGLRATRTTAAAGERSAIEDRVARLTGRLDTFYRDSLIHLEKMEGLGLNTEGDRDVLIASLSERTDELSGRLDLALLRISELEQRLKENPDDSDAPILLVAAEKSLDTNTTSLTTTLDLMDALEQPTERYRAQLVVVTRDISSSLTDTGVAANLLRRGFGRLAGWLTERGPNLLVKTLLIIGILLFFRFIAGLIRRAVVKSLDASKLDLSQLLRRMIVTWAYNLVWILGLLIAMSQLGISLGPLLTGLGVAGFIVGFALQSTLSNFAAGLMILLYRPFDVGDLVDVGGAFGKVERMSLVSTSILTLDHQTLVVPNSMIWGGVIKNVTAQNVRRVDMVFGISYTDDIPHAERVLAEILETHEQVLADPEPVVKLHTLGESSVDFVVRPWAKTDDYWDVYWDVTREVKMRFDAEGISIPFPQRDVHVYLQTAEDRTEAG